MASLHQTSAEKSRVLVVIPVYNDWENVTHLLADLDAQDLPVGLALEVLLVDDGSTEGLEDPKELLGGKKPEQLQRVQVLPLVRNLGHQRAIAAALAFAEDKLEFDIAVVMDADGEDRPEDLPRLVESCRAQKNATAVFARRGRRSESPVFQVFYVIYRALFWLLTGTAIRFGNFSALPRDVVRRLVASSELWMHYAGSIFKLRIPYQEVSADRGRRYQGQSHMSLVNLIVHGLQAIAIYREIACVRIILASLAATMLLGGGIFVVVFLRAFTEMAIPGWASNVVGLFLIMIFQIMTLALFFIFLVLGSRSAAEMLPARDYPYFVDDLQSVWEKTPRKPEPKHE